MYKWCQAGTKHIWLRNNSTIRPCCSMIGHYNSHTYPINKPSDFIDMMISQSWQKKYDQLENGPFEDLCNICIDKEKLEQEKTGKKNDFPSQRLKVNNFTKDGKKFFLKIDFSNKCNLKCAMCSSSRSTGWIKDEEKMQELLSSFKIHFPHDKYTTIGSGWWLDIPIRWWKNLAAVEVSGGEPLYQEEALGFMDFLATNVPDIRLNIITNSTLIDDNIISILKAIKNTKLVCSVDAWEDHVYAYVRNGTHNLKQVKANLKSLYKNNIWFDINDTIHCLNYDQYEKGEQWLKDNNMKIFHNSGHVYAPYFLNINRGLPKSINPKSTEDKSSIFIKWVKALDVVRNTNVLQIRPEFKEWFKSVGM